jgi:poly(A) polymerase
LSLQEVLAPPLDVEALFDVVPELRLARGQEQGPFHHLDTLGHILETIRCVDRELEEGRLGANVGEEARGGLRVAGLLHDVAKPVTRGEIEGRVVFVAHDTLGARLARHVCQRLELSAYTTDLATTLTVLHLKIGFMSNPRSDYSAERLARASGPFGEELAVLCWADRLAARGPRLKKEHIERHRDLCVEFLRVSRNLGPYPEPSYEELTSRLNCRPDAGVGYAMSRLRLLRASGVKEHEALEHVLKVQARAGLAPG